MCECHNNGKMRCIPVDVLQKMPEGRFIKFDRVLKSVPNFETNTFNHVWVNVIVWSYTDGYGHRVSEFNMRTGEYEGEA